MTPIRIAQVVEATVGGVARHVIDLVTHLDPAEFSCVLYLSFQRPESWKAPLCALREQGVQLREIPMAHVFHPTAVSQLAHWAQRDGVDLLHLHSAKAGMLGRQAGQLLGIPAIYTAHAFPFQRTTDWRRPFYRYLERRWARHTARIICVSDGEFDEAIAAGLPVDKLTVIPNGLDCTRWPLPTAAQRRQARRDIGITDAEVVIGTLSRLEPQKGIDLLLESADDFHADFPHARIIIWGEGSQHKHLQRLALRLGLQHVTFAGACADPWKAYAAMDIFCAPSRWEAGPYAVLEAMACGLPVVASAIAGHEDYLEDGVTGLLASTELPGPLAGALRGVLADVDVRDTLGSAARSHVEHEFTLERMIAATAGVYREVAASGLVNRALAAPS